MKVARFMAANPPPPFELWDCNLKTFNLFDAMSTQWRTNMAGPTGLDYGPLWNVARTLRVRVTRKRLADLRAMEVEALRVMNEKSKRR